ncbi:MAG: hypothetical protein WD205_12890 [Rhodothermales bacterium]
MNTFRDCYFDQHVAFGVPRASLVHPYSRQPGRRYRRPDRRSRQLDRRKRVQGSVLDFITPFVCIGLTFWVGVMLFDVVGLEHLVRTPSFDAAGAALDLAWKFVEGALPKLPLPAAG